MKKLLLPFALMVATTLSAEIIQKSVPYEHAGVKLEGYLIYDDEKTKDGPQPGVIVVHEWWGRNDFADKQAYKLAREGYVAFALDMYGAGVETRDAKEASGLAGQFYGKPLMAERAQAGLAAFLATGLVDEKRVAAVGYCFGGSVVQALAYSGAPLAGIVSVHGGVTPATAESAARNQAKFLICHGGADPFVPKEQVDRFLLSLEENNLDYQFIVYAGAKHAFSNEAADKYAALNKLDGVKYQRKAAERSWQHMNGFLEEVLKVRRR
ncbi:MAG: dienelactone hydrolase family protein [Opitutaceae bacterium]|nr:dienelactone hydrolase family protein [Opitutaceae bacterium]